MGRGRMRKCEKMTIDSLGLEVAEVGLDQMVRMEVVTCQRMKYKQSMLVVQEIKKSRAMRYSHISMNEAV